MRTRIRSTVTAGIAIAGVAALSAAALATPPDPNAPPTVTRDVRLAAAPALGAIPLAFLRNQFQYCSVICTHAIEGAVTVPIGAVAAPTLLLGSLAATGSPLQAIGAAAASVTGPANTAVTPLINNDVFLVVPKAFHALDIAVVEAINVGATVFAPGEFVDVVQNGRTNILDALNQPVGTPTTPTGARNIVQVVSVEAINVTTAVAFQAGELLLSGAVQTVDAAAQELARSGDPGAALVAGATQAQAVLDGASAPVMAAVDTALTNIGNSLKDPFPSTTSTTDTKSVTAVISETSTHATSLNHDTDSDGQAGQKSTTPKDDGSDDAVGKRQSAAGSATTSSAGTSSTVSDSSVSDSSISDSAVSDSPGVSDGSAADGSKDNATPSAKKNTTNNTPPK
jgi:hypothetical protein